MSALLLLHGFTGDASSWDSVRARLPRDLTVFAPTLPGHGLDPAPVVGWDATVDGLDAALAARGHDDVHVVGYSLGGRLAWSLAARSTRVRRVTAIGAHPGLPDDDARRARARSDAVWIERLEREGVEAFAARWEALPMWASQRALPSAVRDARRATRRAHTARGLADALRHLGLARMPTPAVDGPAVHLIVGALDARHRALARDAAARTARLRRTVVRGAGHDVVLERPDVIASLIVAAERAWSRAS